LVGKSSQGCGLHLPYEIAHGVWHPTRVNAPSLTEPVKLVIIYPEGWKADLMCYL